MLWWKKVNYNPPCLLLLEKVARRPDVEGTPTE